MNTTPKPKATKKSNGELGPPPPSVRPIEVPVAVGDETVEEDADMIVIETPSING